MTRSDAAAVKKRRETLEDTLEDLKTSILEVFDAQDDRNAALERAGAARRKLEGFGVQIVAIEPDEVGP